MKKILCSILSVAGLSAALISCSSGAYVADSSNPINGSVNPLNPLTSSQFTWPALGTLSATVNGVQWVADSAVYYLDTSGANIVIGYKSNPHSELALYLKNTWQGNLYNMGKLQYNTEGSYITIDSTSATVYTSVLGNSGELNMQQNDTAIFQGRFYFQALTSTGQVMVVNNGYFDLHK